MQKEIGDCNLLQEYNWIQIFDSIYDNATIYNNNFALNNMNVITLTGYIK